MAERGFSVVMYHETIDMLTNEVLIEGTFSHPCIEPPMHCYDDLPILEIHLQEITRVRYVYAQRQLISKEPNNPAVAPLKNKTFTVKCISISYKRNE